MRNENITREIFDFSQMEPEALTDMEALLGTCEAEDFAHVEKICANLLASMRRVKGSRQFLKTAEFLAPGVKVLTLEDLLIRLTDEGGAVVSALECSDAEIAAACLENRYAVDRYNAGFVLRPQRWLDANKPAAGNGKNVVFLETYKRNAQL